MLKRIFIILTFIILLALSFHFLNNQEILPSNSVSLQKTQDSMMYVVTRVVDGDTLIVEDKSAASDTVRLIGINAPESVDPRRKVECFGKEASLELKRLVEGKYIRMEKDLSQQDKDRFQRLLRYVYLEDGAMINKTMIENGYAYEYTYKVAYIYQNEFKKAEKEAQVRGRGLWAANACK